MRVGRAMLVLVAVGLLGGCGSSDSKSSAPASSTEAKQLTKAEFIQRADAICSRYRKRSDKVEKDAGPSAAEQGKAVGLLADEADSALKEFKALGLPAGDSAPIKEYRKIAREQIRLVRRAGEALGAGDVARATKLVHSGDETTGRLRGISQGYGFKVCGSKRR